jgi:hypothetical protein
MEIFYYVMPLAGLLLSFVMFKDEDRGYETDHAAYVSTGLSHLPWAKFEAICSCGYRAGMCVGYEDQKLADAEVSHFLASGCRGSMERREEEPTFGGVPTKNEDGTLKVFTRNRRGQHVAPFVVTGEQARAKLLRLCDSGMTMEEAALRMGDAAKLAAFPLRSTLVAGPILSGDFLRRRDQ